MKTVLFLCTGNYYRSRFAEAFFNDHAERRGLPWRAISRGLALTPINIGPLSSHTIERLTFHGIPVAADCRLPVDVTAADLAAADLVVAVKEAEHRPLVASRFPGLADRVEYWEVHDVDAARPEVAFPHLEREVLGLLDRLAGERSPPADGGPSSDRDP